MQQQNIYAKWCKVDNQPKLSFMTRRNLKFLEEADADPGLRTDTDYERFYSRAQKGDKLGWGLEFP